MMNGDPKFGPGVYFTSLNPVENTFNKIKMNNWGEIKQGIDICLEFTYTRLPEVGRSEKRDIFLLPGKDLDDLSQHLSAIFYLAPTPQFDVVNEIKYYSPKSFIPKEIIVCTLDKSESWKPLRTAVLVPYEAPTNNVLLAGGLIFGAVALFSYLKGSN